MELLNFTPAETAALILSIKVALCCTLVICAPGIFVAWLLAKKSFFGKSLLDGLVHLPLVLPPVIPGFLLLLLLVLMFVLLKSNDQHRVWRHLKKHSIVPVLRHHYWNNQVQLAKKYAYIIK